MRARGLAHNQGARLFAATQFKCASAHRDAECSPRWLILQEEGQKQVDEDELEEHPEQEQEEEGTLSILF